MKLSLSTSFAAVAAAALTLNGSFAAARQNMAERAQSVRQKRYEMMAPRQTSSGNTTFRYLTNQTKPFQVESLPEIHYDLGEMYAGTIPIDMDDPSRAFFWVYQPRIGGPPVDEVTIWFNGGPGCSSLEAFLQENGRFIWGWGQYSALENPYSWTNLTNMLWVEYPIGLGFSQGNVTATSEEETAQDFIKFFKNFEDTFGIKNYKIYVTGESYAGRYVPYVSAAMLDQNDTEYYDLSGALMYDPVIGQYEFVGQTVPTVPYITKYAELFNFNQTFLSDLQFAHEYCGYANYTSTFMRFPPIAQQPAIDYAFTNLTVTLPSNKTISCDVWDWALYAALQPNPCFNVYEISSMCPILSDPLGYPTVVEYQYAGMGGLYFNRTDVKKALHAPEHVDWMECSGPVFVGSGDQYGSGDLSLDPIQKVLPQVIDATKRVLISNGDYDYEIITNGTLLSIQNMTWGGLLGFQEAPSKPIIIQEPDLQYQQTFIDSGLPGADGPGQGVMGVQHFERGLMWAETFQSGHMQPQFQPRSAYRHLAWVLGRIDEL